MKYDDILTKFKVTSRSGDTAQCICPAHKDKKASLTVSRGSDGKTLIHCQAGCNTLEVLKAVGLTMSDLFEEASASSWIGYVEKVKHNKIEGIYHYYDLSGNYAYTHLRMTGKDFPYGVLKNGRFTFGLQKNRKDFRAIYTGNYSRLMKAIRDGKTIFICEGEKDADTLNMYDIPAFTCGSAGEWIEECEELLRGCPVVILADNDKPGINSAKRIAAALNGKTRYTKLIIPTPEKERGDISDYFTQHDLNDFMSLLSNTPEYKKPEEVDGPQEENTAASIFDQVVKVADVKETEAEWLIPFYIPKNQITVLGGTGGSGKTTLECEIVAAITTGRQSVLTRDLVPEEFISEPENVLFLSGEDDISTILKKRLRLAGADLLHVYSIPIGSDLFPNVKINSDTLEEIIKEIRPSLIIFDPIQMFIPDYVKLSERNAVRQHLATLIRYGQLYDVTSLLICHTNKQSNVYGLKRIADSKDFSDAARSVMLVGYAEGSKQHYITHEKNNYGIQQQTILFDINDNGIIYRGRTSKSDRDFITEVAPQKAAPAREEAKEIIIQTLKDHNGKMESLALDAVVKELGVSEKTLSRAKRELKIDNSINYRKSGFNDAWVTELIMQT